MGATLAGQTGPKSIPDSSQLTAGFVGQTRQERGADVILQVIDRTLSADNRLRWVVQLDRRVVARFLGQEEQDLFERLEQTGRVEFHPCSLSMEDFHDLLGRIDIMVFPYGGRYRSSGSGICMESLRSGHVQVVPSRSSMELLIAEHGGASVNFPKVDVSSVADAVIDAVQQFEKLAVANAAAARQLVDADPVAGALEQFLGPGQKP